MSNWYGINSERSLIKILPLVSLVSPLQFNVWLYLVCSVKNLYIVFFLNFIYLILYIYILASSQIDNRYVRIIDRCRVRATHSVRYILDTRLWVFLRHPVNWKFVLHNYIIQVWAWPPVCKGNIYWTIYLWFFTQIQAFFDWHPFRYTKLCSTYSQFIEDKRAPSMYNVPIFIKIRTTGKIVM